MTYLIDVYLYTVMDFNSSSRVYRSGILYLVTLRLGRHSVVRPTVV